MPLALLNNPQASALVPFSDSASYRDTRNPHTKRNTRTHTLPLHTYRYREPCFSVTQNLKCLNGGRSTQPTPVFYATASPHGVALVPSPVQACIDCHHTRIHNIEMQDSWLLWAHPPCCWHPLLDKTRDSLARAKRAC